MGIIHKAQQLAQSYAELDEYDKSGLQDCWYNVTGNFYPTDEEMEWLFKNLPVSIKCDILMWGSSETCTRDKIYIWLKENLKNYQA